MSVSPPDRAARLSIRIDLGNGQRLGPGKAALLRAIDETRSIKAAAGRLNMSYPRALKLLKELNAAFLSPLIETNHGGAAGGGTRLTATGHDVLGIYDDTRSASAAAAHTPLARLNTLTKPN